MYTFPGLVTALTRWAQRGPSSTPRSRRSPHQDGTSTFETEVQLPCNTPHCIEEQRPVKRDDHRNMWKIKDWVLNSNRGECDHCVLIFVGVLCKFRIWKVPMWNSKQVPEIICKKMYGCFETWHSSLWISCSLDCVLCCSWFWLKISII